MAAIQSGRRGAAWRTAVAAGLLAALAGCDTWLGDPEIILPGERVAIRQSAVDTDAPNVRASVGPASSVSDWPMAGGGPNRAVGNVAGSIALERAWSRSIGSGSDSESRIIASPVAAGGRVYTLDAASRVTAVDGGSGSVAWRVDLTPEDEDGRDGFGGGLAVAGEVLIATTGFGEFIALNRGDGSERWRFRAASPVRSAPMVSRGFALAITREGQVVAVDIATGQPVWAATGIVGGASMIGGGGPSVAISGEVVAAPFASGDIAVFRLADGRRGWSEPLGGGRRTGGLTLISDVSASPVIGGGRVYAGSVAGRLIAFDIPSGRRVWVRDIGAYNPALPSGDTLFWVTDDARVLALDAASGQTLWAAQLPRYDDPDDREGAFAYGGPALVGGKLFVVGTSRLLYRIDATSGEIEREVRLPGAASVPPIVANGFLYVLDDDGDLHAYR